MPDLIVNGTFPTATVTPWTAPGATSATVTAGQLVVAVPGPTDLPTDVELVQADLAIQQGVTYTLTFTASANPAIFVPVTIVQVASPNTVQFYEEEVELTTSMVEKTYTFTAPLTAVSRIEFQIGGNPEPWTFTIDNISLDYSEAFGGGSTDSLTFYLNQLADTLTVDGEPSFTARVAACEWASVNPRNYSLAGALNTKAGRPKGQWRSVVQVLNDMAGTKGLSAAKAAWTIIQNGGYP